MADVKRVGSYLAPRRRPSAEMTRARIVQAARSLFARDGYTATTLASVAREAGVAVQTVYATFGSKRAILAALIDAIEVDADFPELLRALPMSNSPSHQVELLVSFNRRLFERGLDVLETLHGAGSAEADLAAAWREGEARRRTGQAPIVHAWAERGVLRGDLTEQQAGDVLWAFTGPDVYRLLVVDSGWPAAEYEHQMTGLLEWKLFGPANVKP